MIDPRVIREDMDAIKAMLEKRNMTGAVDLNRVAEIESARRDMISRSDDLREKRNTLSKEIGKKKSKGENADDLMKQVQGISDSIKELSDKVNELNDSFTDLHLSIPNLLDS